MSDSRALVFKNQYNPPLKCEKCGRELEYRGVGEYHCQFCYHIMYDDYGVVRNYVEENPGSTIAMVSSATGVPERTIKYMIREEKLQIRGDSRTFIECEGCGKPILSGRYCESCSGLAVAAERRKKEKEALEAKKREVRGVSMDIPKGDTGKKRFMGTDQGE